MCCSQLEAANFYWNKRSKNRFPKSALGIKACFPRNQGEKKCIEIWIVQTVSFRLGELGILLHSSNFRFRFHNAFVLFFSHEEIKPLGQVTNTIYFYPSKDKNYCLNKSKLLLFKHHYKFQSLDSSIFLSFCHGKMKYIDTFNILLKILY